jgi:hypothetical protein
MSARLASQNGGFPLKNVPGEDQMADGSYDAASV